MYKDEYIAYYLDGESSKRNKVSLKWDDTSFKIYSDNFEEIIEHREITGYEESDKKLNLHFGDFPKKYLIIEKVVGQKALIEEIKESLDFKDNIEKTVIKSGWVGIISLALATVTLVGIFYFFLLPPISERLALRIPVEREAYLGDRIFTEFTKSYETHDSLTELVDEFVSELDFNYDKELNFTVINSDMVNAFAIMGGKVVVFRGLIDKMETKEELAALLGHEVAHIKQRHSTRALARSLAKYIFVSLIFYDINGISSILIENAQQLEMMQFSRSFERAADEEAFELLRRNELDPKGAVLLFERLSELASLDNKYLNYLSSHPLVNERIERMTERAELEKYPIKGQVHLEEIWKKIKSF